MARSGIIRLRTLLTIFLTNELAFSLAGGYGGGGGEGGYGGGYSGGYGGASVSTSVGDTGNIAAGKDVFIHKNEQPSGNFEGNPFLPIKQFNHGSGQGDLSVSLHKEINLNGLKEGVHSLLGGILGGVSQLGDALAQGGSHPSSGGAIEGCHSRKCQNNPSGSIGNSASASSSSALAGSSFVGFETSNSGHKKHEKHHHNHHTFSPDVSRGPQIREEPNNGHAIGDVSVGKTFGINYSGDQKPTTHNVQYPHGNSHDQGILPSIVIHKEITLGVGGNPSSGSSSGGFEGSYGSIGFNGGNTGFTGHNNFRDKKKNNNEGYANPNGNFGNTGCTSGSCGESAVHVVANQAAHSNNNAGAHSGSVGLGLGNIVLGAGQKSPIPGCSDQSCGQGSPQGNYNYNYSYGGSYSNSYATSFSSSSAASGSYGH